jgi:four helix bundle suffix protein
VINEDYVSSESLIPKHGGYRKLKSFIVSQLVYDLTVRFCERYISKYSRTHDQMVQAARSGVQNIAEGSLASGTSKKTEIKLTNVARASLEELKLDYEDYLRQRSLEQWACNDPLFKEGVEKRFTAVNEVVGWVKQLHDNGQNRQYGHNGQTKYGMSVASVKSVSSSYPEIAANAVLVLLTVACSLLDKQIAAQAKLFEKEGGFTERLYRVRTQNRRT